MYENNTEHKVPVFYRRDEEDFQVWTLSVKTARGGSDLAATITNNGFVAETDEKAFALIVPALGKIHYATYRNVKWRRKYGKDYTIGMQANNS